jgi:Rrf2 family protein
MADSLRFSVSVHLLTLLAWRNRDGGPIPSGHIAASVNTNPVVVRRLMGQLRRAGLVRIKAGPGGGAHLARPAEAITLRDVFDAVERGRLLSCHRQPNGDCPVGRTIVGVLEESLQGFESAARTALEDRTIADVCAQVRFAADAPEPPRIMIA